MSDPQKNKETKDYLKKVTMGDILGKKKEKTIDPEQQQREKNEFNKQIQQKLQSIRQKEQEKLKNSQQNNNNNVNNIDNNINNNEQQQENNIENQNEIKENQELKESTPQTQDKLYKQLAEKYNIPLHVLETQDQAKQNKLSFKEFNKQNPNDLHTNMYEDKSISEAQQLVIQQRLAQRKHISSFKKRKELDPYMQSSFLDKQQESQPQVMRYMENHREFQPMMNIGDTAADMIKKNAVKQMKYEMALTKGDGYLWHAVKTGKLGVDLYLCAFAAVGMFVIPYYFYKVQQKRMEIWRKNRGISKDVKDFEEAGFDLDELSINENHMNMFKDERLEERKQTLDKYKEIQDIMETVLKNK